MFDADELAELRRDWVQEFCPNTFATILRRDVRQGKTATSSKDYKPVLPLIHCRPITNDGGAEVEQGNQVVSVMSFEVQCDWYADVRDTDRLQIGDEIYSVVTCDNGRSDAWFVTATCVRVK